MLNIKRFLKYTGMSLLATATDTLVLWLCSHFILDGTYVGENVISPLISFECGVLVNFIVSYRVVWKDRITEWTMSSFLKHFLPFNLSYTTVFFIKMGILQLIILITQFDVVICNLLALCICGFLNYFLNEKLIFRNKEQKTEE